MKLCMGCMNQMADHLSTCPHCGFNETTLRQESYYLDPGTIVGGKYIVGRVMNYGGHTVSYLGFDAERNRKVIVKEYLPSDFSTRSEGEKDIIIYSGDAEAQFEQGLMNYLNEANRIEKLKHVDGIADIYDCLVENETGYVISEYVEGKTLKELLDSGKKYSVQETVSLIKKILGGLSRVHPLDVIHCDIAPETITITKDGDVKLMDFGATRYVTTANSKSLAIILKQGYAPEEQYRSQGVRGPWTDVYAVAAVMYRMLTGIIPQESVERALMDELKEPSKCGVDLPSYIENALMNALNVYQEDRTKSAEDFLKELNNKETKRVKVKRMNKTVTKVPLWAKGLVACMLLIILVGGTMIFRSASENTTVEAKNCAVPDFSGETIEEAQKKADVWKDSGIDITVEVKEMKYSPDEENNGKIYYQSVTSGTDLLDKEKISQLENEDLVYDDKEQLKGSIQCGVYTNEMISYKELAEKNAYLISQYLKKDITGDLFERDSHSDEAYWTLKSISVKGMGDITEDDLTKDSSKSIRVEDIEKISYYGSAFFKWDHLPDFKEKYGNVTRLKKAKFDRYEYTSEKDIKVKDKSKISKDVISQNFFAFEYAKGAIVGQSIAAGKPFDASEDGGLKVFAIKTQLARKTPKGNTSGTAVKKWIMSETGLNSNQIELWTESGTLDPDRDVLTYSMKKNDETVRYFEKGDSEVKIYLKIDPKPEPKPEPKPVDNNNKKPSKPSKPSKKRTGDNIGDY